VDRKRQLIFLLLLPLAFAGAQTRFTPAQSLNEESPAVVRDLRAATGQILAQGIDEKTVFVGLGASALPFAADLESRLGEKRVVLLPLSSVGQVLEREFPAARFEKFGDAYIDFFLGETLKRGDSVVVFDYGVTGGSLAGLKLLIDGYCARKGCDPARVGYAALAFKRRIEHARKLGKVLVVSGALADLLADHHFDYLRSTARFTPRQWLEWRESEPGADLAAKLGELALPEGQLKYREAVAFFKTAPPEESFFKSFWRRCAALLNSNG
jgi:hypothetical protein